MSTLDPQRVEQLYIACLREDADDPVEVEGILAPTQFSRAKLEEHRTEIGVMLADLPPEFQPTKRGGGGGWSFLNACMDKHGDQWTGLHRTMDQLFQLGIGTEQAKWLMPRSMWPIFPGGMPYVTVFPGGWDLP